MPIIYVVLLSLVSLTRGCLSPLFFCVTVFVEHRLLVIWGWRVTYPKRVMVILNQRRMFFDAFGGVLVASRMYVSTSALLSCYERVFITKKNSIFHDFGILDLRTTEPFRSDSRTFFFLTFEPSDS